MSNNDKGINFVQGALTVATAGYLAMGFYQVTTFMATLMILMVLVGIINISIDFLYGKKELSHKLIIAGNLAQFTGSVIIMVGTFFMKLDGTTSVMAGAMVLLSTVLVLVRAMKGNGVKAFD